MGHLLRIFVCLWFVLMVVGCGQVDGDETIVIDAVTSEVVADESELERETAVSATETPSSILNVQLEPGWTKIEPGGATRCAHDTPFAYWVRPGTVNKLLIYFEGGGGCWDAQTCALGSTFYDPDVEADEDPTFRNGLFNFDHPENPFKDYYAVYIPSCNGDVYWGDKVQHYPQADGTELEIYHHGFINASSALDWAYEHILEPDSIFVTGCSAGSVGSRIHTPYIIENYPNTEVIQMGDSLSFVFGRPVNLSDYSNNLFPEWIPELNDILEDGRFWMADYDHTIANYYPHTTFSQYNTAEDNVQVRFYTAVNPEKDASSFAQDLAIHLSTIHAEAPNFRSFTRAGDMHCILPRPQLYSAEANGIRFIDWLTKLAAGKDVANVQCIDCLVDFGQSE